MGKAVADKTPTLPPLPNSRFLAVFWIAVLIALIMLGRTIWLAKRSHRPMQIYSEELLLPGLRGSIFSPTGQCLAKSSRRLGLFWYLPLELNQAQESWQRYGAWPEMAEGLPPEAELPQLLGRRIRLATEISPELLQLLSSSGEEEEIRMEGFFVRQIINCPKSLRARLGTVGVEPETGLEIGLSGWEAEYDGQLRGRVRTLRHQPGGRLLLRNKTDKFFRSFNGREVIIPKEKFFPRED